MSLKSCLSKAKGFTREEREALLKEHADAVNKGESEKDAAQRIVRARLEEAVGNRKQIEQAVEKALAADAGTASGAATASAQGGESSNPSSTSRGQPATDRRVLARERKAVDEMSPEEKDAEIARLRQREQDLLVNPVSKLPGRKAWEERVATDKSIKAHAAIDMDGLKWINDNMGHAAGDRLLAALGQILRDSGLEAYHLGGDEFAIVYHGERTTLYDALEAVQEEARLISLEFTGVDGKTYLKNGVDFSFSTGKEFSDADQRLGDVKQSRTARGLRAARGETPVGLVEATAGRDEGSEGAAAEAAGETRRRLTEQQQLRKREVAEVRQIGGRLVGAPPGVEGERGRNALVKRVTNLLFDPLAIAEKSYDWYERSGDAIREVAHGDHDLAEKIVRLMALYSQGNGVGANVTAVIKSMEQIARGDKKILAGRFPNQTSEVVPALLAAKEITAEVMGVNNKVLNFYRNLRDATFQTNEYENASTLDRWMMRLFGYKFTDGDEEVGGHALSPTQYAYAKDILARVGREYESRTGQKILPRQLQSVLWSYVRNKNAFDEWKEQRAAVRDALSRAGKNTKQEKVLREKLERLGQKFEPTNASFAEYLDRATARVTWEVMPGRSSQFYEAVKGLAREKKLDLTRLLTGVIRDAKTGKDLIMEKLGVNPMYAWEFGSGAYDGQVSPNVVTGVMTTKDGAKVNSKLASLYAAAVSYVYRQDAYAWHRPDPTLPKGQSVFGIQTTFSRDLSEKEKQDLEDRLTAVIPGAGYTLIGERLARIINYDSSITDEDYQSRVLKALNDWDINAEYEAVGFRSEGEYVERGENDEGYLARIGEAGSPDLQGFLGDLREAVDASLDNYLSGQARGRRKYRVGEAFNAVEGKDYSTEAISVDDRQRVATLVQGLFDDFGVKRDIVGVRPSPTSERYNEVRAAQKLAGYFGKRILWFKDRDGPGGVAGEIARSDSGVVKINIDAQDPLVSILGHELFHDMVAVMSPEERREFARFAVTQLTTSYPGAVVSMGRAYGKDILPILEKFSQHRQVSNEEVSDLIYVAEEVAADMMGSLMTDPQFWNDLALEQPSLFEKLLATIQRFIEKAIAAAQAVVPVEQQKYWTGAREAANTLREYFTDTAKDYAARKARYLHHAGRIAEAQGEARAISENDSRYHKAFHGSPHNFDSFSLDKIGTGEGAQAFGWGLYFAGRKDLAEWYRDRLSNPDGKVFYGGQVLPNVSAMATTVEQKQAVQIYNYAFATDSSSGRPSRTALLQAKNKLIEHQKEAIRRTQTALTLRQQIYDARKGGPGEEDAARELKHAENRHTEEMNALASLAQIDTRKFGEGPKGKLYEVDLKAEEHHYLDLDKTLEEQDPYVQSVIEREASDGDTLFARALKQGTKDMRGFMRNPMQMTGMDLYRAMEKVFGSDENASRALLVAGIPGNKYLDRQSRTGRAQQPHHNYVIFDDQQVAIERKYRRDTGAAEDGMWSRGERGGALHAMGGNVRDGINSVERALQAIRDKGKDYLAIGLQFLGRRQLAEIYGDLLPPVRPYSEEVAAMDAEKNTSGHEAQALANRWGALPDDVGDKLADLMHDATLAQIDPDNVDTHAGKFERATYIALRARFIGLPEEAKAVYREARDMYKAQWRSVEAALIERIQRAVVGGRERQQLIDEVKAKFEASLTGVYFPLARFGDYFVTVKKPGAEGNEEVAFAESMGEARRVQADLMKRYADTDLVVSPIQKREAYNAAQQGANKDFIARIFKVIDERRGDGVDSAAADAMMDSINQIYLTNLPDLSWAKHAIHRKGVKGYSRDARRAFAQNMFHGGYHLARLNHADILQDHIRAMREHISQNRNSAAFDTPTAVSVLNEMIARHEETLSPDNNPVSNFLTGMGFVWHMGLSPATAIVNLSQTALVAYPVLAARFGVARTTAALVAASKDALAHANRPGDHLAGADKVAYDRAVNEGIIDVTMAHDLAGIAQGRDSILDQKWAPVMKAASFLFHETELFNRQATFLAAFRLGRGQGMTPEAAYAAATKAVYDSHFDYSASNRPRVMTGPVARVVLLFKQYSQNMIYTLGRRAYQSVMALDPEDRAEARKQLAGILTMHAAAAGALGLPWITSGALLTIASMIGSDADEPWDAEVALRNQLADAVGKDMAEVIVHGIPRALLPGDLSARVGLNSLLFRDGNPSLEGAAWYEDMATNMLGPVAGIGLNWTKGVADVAKGNTAQGIEQMLPVSISAPLKALRYHREGVVDRTGVDIIEDTTYSEEFAQALGFTPARVKEAYESRKVVMGTNTTLNKRREQLLRDYSMSLMKGDEDKYSDALQAIAKFNETNPAMAIKGSTLRSSIKNRLRRVNESDDGSYLPKEHRYLHDLGRFANVD